MPSSYTKQFYKDVFESLQDYCVFTTDADGNITSWNTGAQTITGYTEEEITGQNAAIFFTEADREAGKPELELNMARLEGRAVDERWHVKKDKTLFWGSGRVFQLKDDQGRSYGFIKILRDQTLEVKMARALELERNKLANFFEKAPAFLAVLRGPDYVFERANEAYMQFTGHRDIIGKPLLEALPEMADQGFPKLLDTVMATGVPYTGKELKALIHRKKDDPAEEVYLNVVYQPDFDTDGNITGILAHGYEVTDQILARKYIEEAIENQKTLQQQKDEFVGIASHELKTPVTSLKAYSQFIEGTLRKAGQLQMAELVGKMNNQIDRLANLITDLLDVTKLNGGKLQFNDAFFDFNEMLYEVVEELQRTSHTHEIITQLEDTVQVWADRFRISQVLTNLISNAIKYSPQAKRVVVSSSRQQKEVMVCVEDFGIGIPEKNRQNLFRRFYRVAGHKENIFPGLGLGLYISSEIIKQEGGRIWMDSQEDKGSVFCFALPVDRRTIPPEENQ